MPRPLRSALLTVEVLAGGTRPGLTRVGDEFNLLALDPDLNSYYVQNIVVKRVPDHVVPNGGAAVTLDHDLPSADGDHVRPTSSPE